LVERAAPSWHTQRWSFRGRGSFWDASNGAAGFVSGPIGSIPQRANVCRKARPPGRWRWRFGWEAAGCAHGVLGVSLNQGFGKWFVPVAAGGRRAVDQSWRHWRCDRKGTCRAQMLAVALGASRGSGNFDSENVPIGCLGEQRQEGRKRPGAAMSRLGVGADGGRGLLRWRVLGDGGRLLSGLTCDAHRPHSPAAAGRRDVGHRKPPAGGVSPAVGGAGTGGDFRLAEGAPGDGQGGEWYWRRSSHRLHRALARQGRHQGGAGCFRVWAGGGSNGRSSWR